MAFTKTLLGILLLSLVSCGKDRSHEGARSVSQTKTFGGSADEAAIWIDDQNPERSIVIGNDKSSKGALFVFDLEGKLLSQTSLLNEAVGASVRYGVSLNNGEVIDVAACALRSSNELKIFKIDRQTRKLIDITTPSGISTGFEEDTYGMCLYKRLRDGQLFAFVSRKAKDHIHQIALEDDGNGKIRGRLVRKFGLKDQKSFMEGMVADDEYGYYYCSDETHALLKYDANPERQGDPLIHVFGLKDGIKGDREGLALYKKENGTGYLIVSSQGNSTFKIYEREGNNEFIKSAKLYGISKTDGIAASSQSIPPHFPSGLFVAHDDTDNNLSFFDWYSFSQLP